MLFRARLLDEKRSLLNIGDVIELENDKTKETREVEVDDLVRYKSFKDIIDAYDIEILADKKMTKKELLSTLEKYYSKDMQKKYGVIGIKIKF